MQESLISRRESFSAASGLKLIIFLLGLIIGVFAFYSSTWAFAAISGVIASVLIFRKPELGILAIAFFLPFERLLTFEVKGYTLQISHLLVLLTFVSWTIRGISQKHINFQRTPLDMPLLAFLLVNLLSMWNAIDKERSVAIFSLALVSVLMYYLVVSIVQDQNMLRKAAKALIVSGILVSLFGLYQFAASYLGWPAYNGEYYRPHVGYMTRIQSTTLEPLIFASYLLVVMPITLSLARLKHSFWKQHWLLVGLVIMGLAMILTISRGGYIGLAIAVLAVFLLSKREILRRMRPGRVFAALAIFVAGIIVLLFVIAPRGSITMTIYQGARSRTMSAAERKVAIERGINFFRGSPFLGIGIGNFGPYSNQLAKKTNAGPKSFDVVNNVPVEVLAESGILGFVALLCIWLSYIRTMWLALRRARDEWIYLLIVGLAAAFLALSFQYLTFSPFYAAWTWFLLGLSMAAARIVCGSGQG